MRLIDADVVMEMLTNIELSCTAIPMIEAKTRLRDIPTAYDVDKVVEWLEERKNYLLKEFVLAEKAREVKEKSLARINEIDEVIENVKAGGTDEN